MLLPAMKYNAIWSKWREKIGTSNSSSLQTVVVPVASAAAAVTNPAPLPHCDCGFWAPALKDKMSDIVDYLHNLYGTSDEITRFVLQGS